MEQTKIYQALMSVLSKLRRPDAELVKALYPLARLRTYRTKEVFIARNEIPYRLGYILEGGTVAYRYLRGEPELVDVWKEDEWIIPVSGLLKPQKSNIDIFCAGNSLILEIDINALEQFRDTHPEIIPYIHYFLYLDFEKLARHIHWLKNTKTQKRIQDFRTVYPIQDHFLSDDIKARYLNMSTRWYQNRKFSGSSKT